MKIVNHQNMIPCAVTCTAILLWGLFPNKAQSQSQQKPPTIPVIEVGTVMTVKCDKKEICVGGSPNATITDLTSADPYVTKVTATLRGDQNAGKTINFSWVMTNSYIGNKTAVTDSNGKASIYVHSGNYLNSPVVITATYGGRSKTTTVAIKAPDGVWQFQNENKQWQIWDGDVTKFYGVNLDGKVNMRFQLAFHKKPVNGHAVTWLVDAASYKNGAKGSPANFGQFIIKTPTDSLTTAGVAKSVFSVGPFLGQIKLSLTGYNVNQPNLKNGQPDPEPFTFTSKPIDQYTWVLHHANTLGDSYPAPSGEEDDEIDPGTGSIVSAVMGSESHTGRRKNKNNVGTWWFSQVVGNDATSAGTHAGTVPFGGFDLVLTQVPVFAHIGKGTAFKDYVKGLRLQGIVCWHRWIPETGSEENELHGVDPAATHLTPGMIVQARNYIRNKSRKFDYTGSNGGYQMDWNYNDKMRKAARDRWNASGRGQLK